jgi:hypothetical protein
MLEQENKKETIETTPETKEEQIKEIKFLIEISETIGINVLEEEKLRELYETVSFTEEEKYLQEKIYSYFESKEKQQIEDIFTILTSERTIAKDYVNTILSVPTEKVLKEANEKWEGTEQRNPVRRYFQWIWDLHQYKEFSENIEQFIQKYIHEQLIQYIPDENTKETVSSILLWKKINSQQERKKISPYPPNIERIKVLLQRSEFPTIGEDMDALIYFSPQYLMEKISSPELKRLILFLTTPPERKKKEVFDYLKTQMTPEVIEEIQKKAGSEAKVKILNALQENNEEEIQSIIDAGKSFGKEQMDTWKKETQKLETFPEEQQKNERERVQTEIDTMLSAIQKAGFGTDVVEIAQKAKQQQIQEIEERGKINETKYIQAKREIYKKIQLEIQTGLQTGLKKGAIELMGKQTEVENKGGNTPEELIQKQTREKLQMIEKNTGELLGKVIQTLEKRTNVFLEDIAPHVKKIWEYDFQNEGEETSKILGQEAETWLRWKTMKLFTEAKRYCRLIRDKESEEILLELSDTDFGATKTKKEIEEIVDAREKEEHEKHFNDAQNSRTVVSALFSYTKKIDSEAVQIKTECDNIKNYLRKKLEPYLQIGNKSDRLEQVIGEMTEIAQEVNIEAKSIRESFSERKIPQIKTYGILQKWANTYAIPFSDAEKIVVTLFPASEILFLGEETFFKKALTFYGIEEEKSKELYQWYKNTPASFARRFSDCNGNIKQLLLETAGDKLEDASSSVLSIAEGNTVSEGISKEELEQKHQKVEKDKKKILEYFREHLQKSTELVKRIQSLQQSQKIPEHLSDVLFRAQKMLEKYDALNAFKKEENYSLLNPVDYGRAFEELEEREKHIKEIVQNGIEKEKSDIEKILQEIDKSIQILETKEKTEIEREYPPKEIPEDIWMPSERMRQEKEIQEEREEIRKKNLQRYAEWITSQGSLEEIKEVLEQLENGNGEKILHILSDEEFEKHHEKDEKAVTVFKNNSFEIHVRETNWNQQGNNMLTSLRHEGYHILDIANKKSFSKKLEKELKKNMKNFKGFRKRFCTIAKIKSYQFAPELFAYMMANKNEDERIQALIAEVPQEIRTLFTTNVQKYSEGFSEKGIQTGIFGGKEEFARKSIYHLPEDALFTNFRSEQIFKVKAKMRQFYIYLNSLKQSTVPGEKKQECIELFEIIMQNRIYEAQYLFNNVPEEQRGRVFESYLGKISTINAEISNVLAQLAQAKEPDYGIIETIINSTECLSGKNIMNLIQPAISFLEQKYKRNSDLKAGIAGKAMFDKIAPNLANHFDNKKESSEADRVAEIERGLKNMDAWSIMERIDETKHKDELKACLNVLAGIGAIDWYDDRIWFAMQRVNRGIGIKINEADATNRTALRTLLKRMCTILWDKDYFRVTDRNNSSNYSSGKSNYMAEISSTTDQTDGIIISMLQERRNGQQVDPQRFEAFVDACIAEAASTPEMVFWYILQGVHHGLLNMDRIFYFTGKHNDFPALDWFGATKAKLNELREIAQKFPPDENGEAPPGFIDWFLVEVISNDRVQSRMRKQKKTDHDWSTTNFANADIGAIKQYIKKRDGETPLDLTAYPNILVGQLAYTTAFARYNKRFSSEKREKEVIRQLTATAFYNAALLGNMKVSNSDREYHSLEDFDLKNPSRTPSTVLYNSDTQLTAREMITKSNEIIIALEPKLFSFLREEEGKPGFAVNVDELRKTVQHINTHGRQYGIHLNEHNVGQATGEIRGGEDVLAQMEMMIEKVLKKEPQNIENVFNIAQKVYKDDHGDQLHENRIDEDSTPWQEKARRNQSLGSNTENLITNRGMYR